MPNPIDRFTHLVANYQAHRPSYPQEFLQLLIEECGLTSESIVADIGSGTGLLTKLLLANGNIVYAVEPNNEMRAVAEKLFGDNKKFYSVKGTAETTSLNADSIDLITVGTAFHWFDADKAKLEFIRILKTPGFVALIWNVRAKELSGFMADFETLIEDYCPDYKGSKAEQFNNTAVASFFAPYEMHTAILPNQQIFDFEGLHGRLLSASYSLRPSDAKFSEMIAALKRIFDSHQKNDRVTFLYQAKVYYGRLK